MNTQNDYDNYTQYLLSLKSHTKRNRIKEAMRELAALYPFEIKEDFILITKTEIKGQYKVLVFKEKLQQKINVKRIIVVFFFISIIVCFLCVLINHLIQKKIDIVNAEKESEKIRQEYLKIQDEKNSKLIKLKKEYEEKEALEYEKLYPYIERIYSVMTDKTTIENVTIDKNVFSVEVKTKDAISVLSNFEKSMAFVSTKMTRTTIKNGIETVTYNGEFSRFHDEPDSDSTIDEKIFFYEKELKEKQERNQKMHMFSVSEYIGNIRALLRKNGCNEQYIQLKGKNEKAEIEFFILSSSKNILKFINEIQNDRNNLIDIKSFSLRNSENPDGVQTTICFDTGIEIKQEDKHIFDNFDSEVPISDMNNIFYKAPVRQEIKKIKEVSQKAEKVQQTETKKNTKSYKTVSFVGLTKKGNTDYVIVKDDEMDCLYKLILSESEIDGDFCFKDSTTYRAYIHGESYEVKK